MLRRFLMLGVVGFLCLATQPVASRSTQTEKLKDVIRNAFIVKDIKCGDNTTKPPITCKEDFTCCPVANIFGCCDLPQAVCCKDQKSCCPHGFKCDLEHVKCVPAISGDSISPRVLSSANKQMTDVRNHEKKLGKDVACPDGISYCNINTTCCKVNTGQYGCCPYVEGVCCSDNMHCCPNGHKCDLSAGSCIKSGGEIKMMEKIAVNHVKLEVPKLARKANSIVCPDRTSQCPDGTTCCKLITGQYGCCPIRDAVCCNDSIHCCPSGYKCDVGAGTCIKSGDEINMMKKIESNRVELAAVIGLSSQKLETTNCSDGTKCPGIETCCKLVSGDMGCCLYPNAICCDDNIHCCPGSYACTDGKCHKKGEVSIKALAKVRAIDANAVCPDGHSQCPDGSTCCKLNSGEYGCCPIPNAVCCSDGLHCCPQGYTCDVSAGTCMKGPEIMKALMKIVAKDHVMSPLSDLKPARKTLLDLLLKNNLWGNDRDNCVMCPDDSECPNFNTCCEMSDGKYGCCRYANAVCCSDRTHCCPHGSACDAEQSQCVPQDFKKQPMSKMTFEDRKLTKVFSAGFDEM